MVIQSHIRSRKSAKCPLRYHRRFLSGRSNRLPAPAAARRAQGLDLLLDPRRPWCMLPVDGYRELPASSEHAVAVNELPPLHKDPFDRILVAQAKVEG